jgi:hypothetical protein
MSAAVTAFVGSTPGAGIIGKHPGKKQFHCLVRIPFHTAIYPDTRSIQGVSGCTSNAAADQNIHAHFL